MGASVSLLAQTGQSEEIHSPEEWASRVVRCSHAVMLTRPTMRAMVYSNVLLPRNLLGQGNDTIGGIARPLQDAAIDLIGSSNLPCQPLFGNLITLKAIISPPPWIASRMNAGGSFSNALPFSVASVVPTACAGRGTAA
jgi:hypothetical protein